MLSSISPRQEILLTDALSCYTTLISSEIALAVAILDIKLSDTCKAMFQSAVCDDHLLYVLGKWSWAAGLMMSVTSHVHYMLTGHTEVSSPLSMAPSCMM